MTHRTSFFLLTWLSVTLLFTACGGPTADDFMLQSMQKSVSGDQAGALADITRAINLRPEDTGLYIVRAGIHEATGDLASTIQDYEAVLRLSPALEPGLAAQLSYLRKQVGGAPAPAPSPAPKQAASVKLTNLVFCAERPAGDMDYVAKPGATYRPGETVWIYFNLRNLAHKRTASGGEENAYSQRLSLKDPSGNLLMDKVIIDDRRTPGPGERPDQLFLRNKVPIPDGAAEGVYDVDLFVMDKLSLATTHAKASFTVRR